MLLVVLPSFIIIKHVPDMIYLMPVTILSMLLVTFFDARMAIFIQTLALLIISLAVPNSYQYFVIQFFVSLASIFALSNKSSRSKFFYTSAIIFLAYIIMRIGVALIFDAGLENVSWNDIGIFAMNALFTMLSLPLIFLFERMFGFVTDMTLLELSNTNTPTTDLWYVTTIFNSEKTTTASRTQIAHPYDKQLAMYTRYYVVGVGWSKWTATDIVSFTHDHNNGHVHFANGLLIQWGKFTFTPSAANTVVSAIISFPIVYDETPRVGADPHSAEPNTIECSVGNGSSNYNALRSMTVFLRKTNTAATPFQWMAIGYKKPTEGVV
jgi:hypothetical protein